MRRTRQSAISARRPSYRLAEGIAVDFPAPADLPVPARIVEWFPPTADCGDLAVPAPELAGTR